MGRESCQIAMVLSGDLCTLADRYENFSGIGLVQLEFDKIEGIARGALQYGICPDPGGIFVSIPAGNTSQLQLQQTHEFKQLMQNGQHFPNDYTLNLSRELKLLGIPGAVLSGEQFLQIRRLAESMQSLFRWFDADRRTTYPAFVKVIEPTHYEKAIITAIDEVLDESGTVRDNASEELAKIRMNLFRRRNELRRLFDRIVSRLGKAGYVADIEESF
jgi:DNA mismatch repair protein MutS2